MITLIEYDTYDDHNDYDNFDDRDNSDPDIYDHPYYVNYEIFDTLQERQDMEGQHAIYYSARFGLDAKHYKDYLENYGNISPWSLPIYQHPELYFWAIDNKLRILGSPIELDMQKKWNPDTLAKAHLALGPEWYLAVYNLAATDSAWPGELMRVIYNYLCLRRYTEYYKNLLQFKWHTGLRSFPLFDRYKSIRLIDGRLFGYFPNQNSWADKDLPEPFRSWSLLTTAMVNKEIKRLGGMVPPEYSGIKTAVSKLVQQLVGLHQNDPFATIDDPGKHLTAAYLEGNLEFIPALKGAKFFPHSNRNTFFFTSLGPIEGGMKFSQPLENCLFNLTNGDLNKLDLLAEFFARIACSTTPSKYLWYIHGNASDFSRFLFQFVDNRTSNLLYTAKNDEQNNLITLSEAFNTPIQCNYSPLSTDEFAKLKHSKMVRYLNGGEILELDDQYQTVKSCNYYPAVLFISEGDTINTSKAFKNLPWKEICVPDDWTDEGLYPQDYQWLKTCLVARGLQMIAGFELRQQKSEQFDLEQIVRQFADTFCEEDSDSYINGKDLYNAIFEYTGTFPYTIELPGSSTFLGSVEQWIGRKRKEVRRNKNRMGFEGIRLNEDKLKAALAENKSKKGQEQRERAERSFHDYLNEITSLVL